MQVKGLQFNPLSPHLLASAGMDGELAIWDLSDPRQPKQYPPLKVQPTLRSPSPPPVMRFRLACAPSLLQGRSLITVVANV